VFNYGTSELLNRLARLSVLFEDLRIEWGGLPENISLGDLDTIGSDYRRNYFLRRSLVTLIEFRDCLTEVLHTKEFRTAEPTLSDMDKELITTADQYFKAHNKRMKEFRNVFGGHLDLRSVEFATSRFTAQFVGKISWDKSTGVNYSPPLQLHYANEIIAGVFSSKLQDGSDMVVELRTALELITEDTSTHTLPCMHWSMRFFGIGLEGEITCMVRCLQMPTNDILTLLIAERDKLNRAIEVLQGTPRTAPQPKKATPATDVAPATNHTPKRRAWTPAMRLAARRRARVVWVRRRKEAGKKG